MDSTLERPWSPLLIPVLLLRPYAKGLKGPPLVGFVLFLACYRASLVAQTVKRLLSLREAWVRSLGREDPLAKEMAPHCSTLAWKIPWTSLPNMLLLLLLLSRFRRVRLCATP